MDFALAGIFLLLYPSLPGEVGLVKGLSFAVIAWFLRVVMGVASQWMMYKVPAKTLVYSLLAGLGEMLVLEHPVWACSAAREIRDDRGSAVRAASNRWMPNLLDVRSL